ncbi:pyruvate ferredoxin oxidoreductase [uncultured archaeon]|nr:pyruvate ferredoxin oxidoreductase [uncultured archaeon]
MAQTKALVTGNEAAAIGVKLSDVRFISAYPITPQTTIVEKLAEMVANEELDARYVEVESEHSAMTAVFSSELTGVRSYTATSSHGLLYMHEMLHWTAGMRLPIVVSVVNRAIGPPWNIWADQTDSMNQKDTGWLQVYCESNQEVLDTIIMGYRIAEDRSVKLPLMSMEDAFILSHTSEPVTVPDISQVRDFLPEFDLDFTVDFKNPMGYGSYSTPDGPFMELKKDMADSMNKARAVIEKTYRDFSESFGRDYAGLTDNYMMEDAEFALVATGTLASTAKHVVNLLRNEGKKVGLVRVKFFRPFPSEEIVSSLKGLKGAGVIDRSLAFSDGGSLYSEVSASLYRKADVPLTGFVAGLGGRDVRVEEFRKMYEMVEEGSEGIRWINTKGGE